MMKKTGGQKSRWTVPLKQNKIPTVNKKQYGATMLRKMENFKICCVVVVFFFYTNNIHTSELCPGCSLQLLKSTYY